MKRRDLTWQEAAAALAAGGVGVVPTDTLYGLVGSALDPGVVERVYELRVRDRDKPLIVLLADATDMARFKIGLPERTQELFKKVWPGPVSVVVAADEPELAYLHRGTGGIAFRVPDNDALRGLLREAGPLVAPSANLAGEPSARTVDAARGYFGEQVFYLDAGRLDGAASAVVDVRGAVPKILRDAPGFDPSKLV